jgi:hypothetical protein
MYSGQECRRAKRTKKWIKQGNIVPLSTSERKCLENKSRRTRYKLKKEVIITFETKYQDALLSYVYEQKYNIKGVLTYEDDVSMYKCYKDSMYILGLLKFRNIIDGFFFVSEHKKGHNHTHFLIKTGTEISQLKRLFIKQHRYGHTFLGLIENELDLIRSVKYLVSKIDAKNKVKNSEVDYWNIGV